MSSPLQEHFKVALYLSAAHGFLRILVEELDAFGAIGLGIEAGKHALRTRQLATLRRIVTTSPVLLFFTQWRSSRHVRSLT
jgi:hypothetical protein